MFPSGIGESVQLAGAFGGHRGVTNFLEVGQGGIDHAGARHVETFGALIQFLDDLVSIARFFVEQLQYQQLQIPGGEFPAHAESAAAHAAAFHNPSSEMAEAVVAAMASDAMIKKVRHSISRYVVRHILRYMYLTIESIGRGGCEP